MDTLMERVRAADPVRPGEFDGLANFDALELTARPRRRRRLLALPAGAVAAAAAAFVLIPASAPQAREILRRATESMAVDQGILYAEVHATRTATDGSSDDYGTSRSWVGPDGMRMLQVSGPAAGNEEVTANDSITAYRPDGTTETMDHARQVPGEIFRGADLLHAGRAGSGVELVDETSDAYVLRWREPSGPPHHPTIEMTLWVDKHTYAPLKFADHSWGLDADGKPFDETLTQTVVAFRRLDDTPENEKLLQHGG